MSEQPKHLPAGWLWFKLEVDPAYLMLEQLNKAVARYVERYSVVPDSFYVHPLTARLLPKMWAGVTIEIAIGTEHGYLYAYPKATTT